MTRNLKMIFKYHLDFLYKFIIKIFEQMMKCLGYSNNQRRTERAKRREAERQRDTRRGRGAAPCETQREVRGSVNALRTQRKHETNANRGSDQ